MSGNRKKSRRYYYDYYGRQMTPEMPTQGEYPTPPLPPMDETMGQLPMDLPPEMGMDMDMPMEMGMEGMPMATLPMNVDFAKAYVPIQHYAMAFSPQEALRRGTLFPELYQPQFYIKPIPK